MTNDFVVSLCKTISVFVIVLSCSYTVSLKLTLMHMHLCATFSVHNVVPMHKSTLRKGVHKCIHLRSAPQPRYKGGNSLREYHDARRAHRSTPGGPFHCRSECSATPRFRWRTGDAHRAARAQGDEHVALPTWDAPLQRRKFRWIQNIF